MMAEAWPDGTVIRSDGSSRDVAPADGETFSLSEMQGYVGGSVEHITLEDGRDMWIDEEGKMKGKGYNYKATDLLHNAGGWPGDYVAGDALITAPGLVQ